MNDHDLLTRIDERVGSLQADVGAIKEEVSTLKTFLQSNSKRVSHLEGQMKAVWWILGGGGILSGLLAGLMALLGRKG